MNVQIAKTPAETGFLAEFEAARDSLPGAGTGWVEALRHEAIGAFEHKGLPHRRIEEWKYTDLRTALAQALPLAARTDETVGGTTIYGEVARHRLIFSNGFFRPDLSDVADLPEGVEVMALADAIGTAPDWVRENLGRIVPEESGSVVALNTALMAGGIAIRVGAGVELDRPVELAFAFVGDAPAAQSIRNLVVLDPGARVSLLESWRGTPGIGYMTNTVTELVVGKGAKVDHVKIQEESMDATHLACLSTALGEGAGLNTFAATTGARLSRNEISLRCTGPGSEASISGAYMITGRQHCDSTMTIDHAVPSCVSKELFKGVIDGRARGVFQGKIIVRPDAQKTDGRMMTQGLLLSETAELDAKPELEIFADDVQCAHGATSGELDDDLLFYLRSRGIPEVEAKTMLIQAFVGEAFETVASEEIREILNALAGRWLVAAGGDAHA